MEYFTAGARVVVPAPNSIQAEVDIRTALADARAAGAIYGFLIEWVEPTDSGDLRQIEATR